jgi:hypothetical protein
VCRSARSREQILADLDRAWSTYCTLQSELNQHDERTGPVAASKPAGWTRAAESAASAVADIPQIDRPDGPLKARARSIAKTLMVWPTPLRRLFTKVLARRKWRDG